MWQWTQTTGKHYAERINEALCYFDHLCLGLHWNDLQLRQTVSVGEKKLRGNSFIRRSGDSLSLA